METTFKNDEIFYEDNDLLTVVSHLIYNARDTLINRKTSNPIIELSIKKEINTINFYIEDNAGGIDEKIKGRIFDPFFTTKEQSFATGLGLYKCHMLINKILKSSIDVQNTKKGAKFIINLKNLT